MGRLKEAINKNDVEAAEANLDKLKVIHRYFQMPKMKGFLYENHWGGPALRSLNVLVVLGVLNYGGQKKTM